MNAYEATFSRLQEKGFVRNSDSDIETYGVALFNNEHKYVLLQYFDEGISLKDIQNEAILLRGKLHQMKVNVWNTYYLLCADTYGITNVDASLIERDSSGLRKYVITSKEDLNRIPFLDNHPVYQVTNPIKIEDSISREGIFIKNLFDFIDEHNGTEKIISDKSIDKLINGWI